MMLTRCAWVVSLGLFVMVLLTPAVHADPLQDALTRAATDDAPSIVRSFLLLSALSIIPLLLISVTSFTRIIVVLSLVRRSLGLQQTPPNIVLITLGLFLTLFTMMPVLSVAKKTAMEPYLAHKVTLGKAAEQGFKPFKLFMLHQTRESDLLAIVKMAGRKMPRSIADVTALEVVPAFMLSELRTAFQIGFVIFLPFLLIDLVVAAILMALGMIMVPPSTISLPLKILLFLLVNGWTLIAQALLSGYHIH